MPQPTVHIGQIDVIVEAPALPQGRKRPLQQGPADLSSRLYLRGL